MTERAGSEPLGIKDLSVAVAAAALALAACGGCRSTGPGASKPAAVGSSDPGPPTVRLVLLTDVAGALEPCGCTRDQLGGVNHFGAWLKADRGAANARMVAAAGPLFFMNPKLDAAKADQDRAKADAIARILRGLDFQAFAPGANDWAAGVDGLAKLGEESGAVVMTDAPPPSLSRDAGRGGAETANALPSFPPAGAPFGAWALRDVPGTGLKIGFVGVGAPALSGNGASIGEPGAALVIRRAVDDARAHGANVLVALAAVGRGEAKRIADAVPELAAIVVGSPRSEGDSNTTAPPGERVGDVLIVQAANHLQSVAVLDLYLRDPVLPGRLVSFADGTGLDLARRRQELAARVDDLHIKIANWERDKSIAAVDLAARRADLVRLEAERDALDARPPPAKGSFFRYSLREIRESLGSDPAIDADLLDYYKRVDEHNRVEFADRVRPPAAPGEPVYVGVEACSTCHPGARAVWNGTPHAHAYATLASAFKEYNLDCVSCHVTGYEKPGGSTVTHVDGLKDVQCEVCHGPGSRHAESPGDKTLIVARPSPSACLACHHSPHVEGFDPVAATNLILGPGHGRR